MITNVLIQKVLRIRGDFALNIERFDIRKRRAQSF